MQIAPSQLAAMLQRGLKSLYTLCGDELLLRQEALDDDSRRRRAHGYSERSSHTVAGAHFDWSEVLAAGGSLSLCRTSSCSKSTSPAASRARKAGGRSCSSWRRPRAMTRC